MTNALSKSERLERIVADLCDGNKSLLAEKLGKSQQNMSSLIKNGIWFDACALKVAFPELNPSWLLTGEGEMMIENNN